MEMVEKEIARVEKAALASSFKRDTAGASSQKFSKAPRNSTHTNKAGKRYQGKDQNAARSTNSGQGNVMEAKADEKETTGIGGVLAEGDILGQYEIDGQLYLQGDYHEESLLLGTSCQGMHPIHDEWRDGRIEDTKEVVVESTNKTARKYLVWFASDESSWLSADDIRLVASSNATIAKEIESGIGEWTAVSRHPVEVVSDSDDDKKVGEIAAENDERVQAYGNDLTELRVGCADDSIVSSGAVMFKTRSKKKRDLEGG